MKCASCGKDNPAGARYCIECGAEHSLPTPIAAVAAAAMTSRPRNAVPQAANAAQADPALDPRKGAERERRPRADHGASAANAPRASPEAAPAGGAPPPAYASAPRRTGLAAALVVACVAVALIVFAGWRMLGGDASPDADSNSKAGDDSVMSSFPPEATPQRQRRAAVDSASSKAAPEPAPAVAPVPPASRRADAAPGAGQSGAEPGSGAGVASPAPPVPPVEIKPLPAKPAPKPAPKPSRRQQTDKAPASPPPSEKAPAAAQVAEPPPPQPRAPETRAPVVAAAPKSSPVVDRWTRMSDELSRCTREDFISRVICDQRVRLRYCDGYWGKVAQCPAYQTPDRGQ